MGWLVVDKYGNFRGFNNEPHIVNDEWVSDNDGIEINPSNLSTHLQDLTVDDKPVKI